MENRAAKETTARTPAAKGRRRVARVVAWIGVVLLGVPLLLLVLISLPPVTSIVVRKLLPKINQQLNGRLTVAGIGGTLLDRLELRGVALRDPEGQVVLQAERVDVRYSVWDLLHHKITLGQLGLERPIVRLLKDHPGEQYSIMRIFTKESNTTQRPGTMNLTIRDIALRGGSIIATVWRRPAAPQQETAQQLDTVQLQNVNLSLPLLHYSSSPTLPRAALLEIASARAFLSNPELELDQLQGNARLDGDSLVIVVRSIRLPASTLNAEAWLVTAPNRRRFDATAHIEQLAASDFHSFVKGADIPSAWALHGDLRTTSLTSGSVLVQGRNLDITLAGGHVTGRLTVVGQDNEWSTENSRLDVAGVQVARVLRAFHVPSSLQATIDGFVTADGRAGSADLRLAGAAGYGVRGPVNGRLTASGSADSVRFDTRLGGSIGSIMLSGEVAMGRHLAAHGLRGEFHKVNLAALDARMPASSVNGRLSADVLFGSMPREGSFRLYLDSSVVRNVPIDTMALVAHAENGQLTTDDLFVRMPGLQVRGKGTFGLYEDQTGDLTLTLDAPSLHALEPVVAALTRDSVADFDGAVRAVVTAHGSLKQHSFDAVITGRDLVLKGHHLDSLSATAGGTTDSVKFAGRLAVDSVTAVSFGGRKGGQAVKVDSLSVVRGKATWSLDDSSHIALKGKTVRFERAVLRRAPAAGSVALNGSYPGTLFITARDIPMADIVRLSKRDSLPNLNATATVASGTARGHVTMVMNGRQPLLLDFTSKPLHARLQADALNLAMFGPAVPSLRQLTGLLDGTLTVDGSTDAPQLEGKLTLTDGGAAVPATGVHYTNARGTLAFYGQQLTLNDVQVDAGKGHAFLAGTVRFAQLTHPELAVDLKTDHFPVMNRHDFLEASATGQMQLRGSPSGATLTGNATVNEGNAYLEHFMHSAGIDLSDSLYAQFVDTSVLLETTGRGRSIVESLMDSLKLAPVTVDLGDNFWLKSTDASIQLAGKLTVRTGGTGRQVENGEKYLLNGTVRTVRGLYRMSFAPGLTREFTIKEGSIRYFGSPKKDAMLDLTATHLVSTANGDEVTITAHLGGSLAQPTIQLSSDVSPPLSQTELISYLVFGAPTAQEFLGSQNETSQHQSVFEKSADQLVGVLSGKVENAVVSQLGLPIDYFRIKPGEVQSGLAGTELVLGMQVRILGYPSFLRASPRFCPREQLLSLDHIGIDLETRLSHQWGVATSVDPMETCESLMSGTAARPYQFGVDLFWEKR